jgi:hypothetical protein
MFPGCFPMAIFDEADKTILVNDTSCATAVRTSTDTSSRFEFWKSDPISLAVIQWMGFLGFRNRELDNWSNNIQST